MENGKNIHEQVTTIVAHARGLGTRDRGEYVRRACGADETLLSHVLQALADSLGEKAAHEQGFWDEVAVGERNSLALSETLEGQLLGRYRILRKLGSGGMGDVYLAERADEEYQQRVALKIVRGGLFSPQIQSRLRMERQILATLQHPNIARLLDGGRAPDGTPYLVMEYIDGEPIDTYCDRRRLSVEARLQLIRTICGAVHYAHQNLIVHRDLKPNNILITPDGVPKLLDFGIAKLLDSRHSAHTLAVTHFEYRVMTPAHASPEQVRGDVITTASDIYVLGVLLYELLCGRRPFLLVGTSLTDMERIICEQEAPTPSSMVAQVNADAPELMADIASRRSTTPARLQKQLRGDLDNIIGMAMRKDPERRYASAEQLAADLEHHLTGQPVLATRDTWLYRTRKFVKRHSFSVAASVVAVLTLAAFSAVTYIQAQRIAAERDVATAERTRAEQISSFLVELFELSDPSRSRGNQVTAREILDIGARRIRLGLNEQPETRATLLGTIGRVYGSMGLYESSVELLEDALQSRIRIHGERHPDVALAHANLGAAFCDRGQLDACGEQLDRALAMQKELLGTEAVAIAPTLLAHGRLAQLRGELDNAEQFFKDSLAVYRLHQQERSSAAASVMNELAGLYTYRNEYERAATLYRAALDIDRQALGNDHPQVGMHVQNLGFVLQSQGKLSEAAPLFTESLQILSKVLGETHPMTLDATANYGRFLHRRGDLQQAEQVLVRVVDLNRKARGEQHPFVGHDLVNLGMLRVDAGNPALAQQDFTAALAIYAVALPPDHPFAVSALSGLGRAQLEQGRLEEAEQTLRKASQLGARSLAADSPTLASVHSSLGRTLLALDRAQEASPLLQTSYPILAKAQGEDAAITRRTKEALDSVSAR
ncbi:serine/threonine protein kinase [Steroidobacter sp. S1-65]|uniref:Serine/threonine protein kinase n=1 Tax=Steroidobacter gossypii TaxID=2805490 RepID=A0ABS1WU55_9GAMM|nr:tetratricopeptide repeat protein [Steroidobacter gossypii]MBM0104508.1 serine/threonine protein kinase [Steroidobacter gossypii]